ncbi:WD40 repeat domain-containing protein [Nonomuraea typhae]|uniref:WD40 repeat domain-containing protein n=1 Tax=Nonomuraea typhae TaxID=2603600 RepID=A0ABW7YZD5_9ACTN
MPVSGADVLRRAGGSLRPAELRQAIVEPATEAGLTLENGLIEVVLRDLGVRTDDRSCTAGTLPLLSHSLRTTWQHRSGEVLTLAGYERSGGVQGAVAATAERTWQRLTPEQQATAERLLLQMVRIGDGGEVARRPAELAELLRQPGARPVLEAFARARLITLTEGWAELAHEVLLPAWPRLTAWVDGNRAGLRIRQRLTGAAQAWHDEDRDPALLCRGGQLAVAGEWMAAHPGQAGELAAEFLRRSQEAAGAERRRERERARRLRYGVAALSVLLVLALVAGGVAAQQRIAAQHETALARSRLIAAQAHLLREADPSAAMQLAVSARRYADTPQARGAIISSSGVPLATRLPPFAAPVAALALRPDGRILATADAERGIRLWAASARPVLPATLGGWDVAALAYAQDVLVVGDEGGAVHVWRPGTPGSPAAVMRHRHAGAIVSVAVDGRGSRLASADESGALVVHDARSGERIAATRLPSVAEHIALSPDGQLVAASGAWRVRVWKAGTLAPSSGLIGGSSFEATGVSISADGRLLAAGGTDHATRLWRTTGARAPAEMLIGHGESVTTTVFSPHDATVATASTDRSVLLWDTGTRQHSAPLYHPQTVDQLAVAPGLVATAATDQIVRLWHLPPPVVTGHTGNVQAAAYRRDGHVLATTSDDDTIRLWDIAPDKEQNRICTHTGAVLDPGEWHQYLPGVPYLRPCRP